MPGAARAILLVAVIALAGAFALVATGAISAAVAGLGGSIGGLLGGLTGSPTPQASTGAVAPDAAPRLEAPDNPYTSTDAYDLRGLLPSGVAGSEELSLRVFVGAEEVDEVPVPPTADFLVTAIPLTEGENEITAAIVSPDGEGPRSVPIVITLDTKDPGLAISAPADKSRVKAAVQIVTVEGTTQPGANVSIRNGNTGGSASVDAATGVQSVGIADGTNTLTVTATDQAGNETTKSVSVLRGSGKLTAQVDVSPSRLKASRLPEPYVLRATVGRRRQAGARRHGDLQLLATRAADIDLHRRDERQRHRDLAGDAAQGRDRQGRRPGDHRGDARRWADRLGFERLPDTRVDRLDPFGQRCR